MKVSISWLKDYVDIDISPRELADKLTMAGISVENISYTLSDKIVTGRIEYIEDHPNSDHLLICQVNIGNELIQIVTNANVKVGQIVPVALASAVINGHKIVKSKLRGVESEGMFCSAKELNIDESENKIYVFPKGTQIGVSINELFNNDTILEIELTANRSDCLSIIGLAREIAVLTGKELKIPIVKKNNVTNDLDVEVETDLCNRYSICELNMKIDSSPEWIRKRLLSVGIEPVNNIVDVTNFVMMETGQPIFVYDSDKIVGGIKVRTAKMDEQIFEHEKLVNDLVVADDEKILSLAGIKVLNAEVTDETENVVIEAANWDNASIRRTARRIGLRTETSNRFEHGISTDTVDAINRVIQLLGCNTNITDKCIKIGKEVEIEFVPEKINERLGINISREEMKNILEKLGFRISDKDKIVVPSWRKDMTIWEDLSEEVARIYGYDNIPSTLPKCELVQGHQSDKSKFIDKIKMILASLGMNETISFSFINANVFNKLNIPKDSKLREAVPIMNPLNDNSLLRTTLLASIMENVVRNYNRKNEDIRLFEIGTVFYPKQLPVQELPDEIVKVAGVIMGKSEPRGWNQEVRDVDFYDIKGIIEELLGCLSIDYTVEVGEHYAMHPGKTACFKCGSDLITIGEVHPLVMKAFNIDKKMYIFEGDVKALMNAVSKKAYKELPKYPAINRDLAIVVDKDVLANKVEESIISASGEFFNKITLFDVYTGDKIDKDKKSLTFNIEFQSNERTLTNVEINDTFIKIIDTVEKQFNAQLRK